MKVTVNEWVPVAVWKWPEMSTDDVCGICRSAFEATCPSCTMPGFSCPPLSGKCSHSFHRHCIEKWLKRSEAEGTCPMCRRHFVPVGESSENEDESNSSDNSVIEDAENGDEDVGMQDEPRSFEF